MRKLFFLLFAAVLYACGGGEVTEEASEETEESGTAEEKVEMVHEVVTTEDTVAMDADQLWAAIASFDGVENVMPGVIVSTAVEGEGVGAKRTLTMADDGGEIYEEMIGLDEENKKMTYKIISSPLPVENYVGSMTVSILEDGSTYLSWTSEYDILPENAAWKDDLKGLHNLLFETLNTPPEAQA